MKKWNFKKPTNIRTDSIIIHTCTWNLKFYTYDLVIYDLWTMNNYYDYSQFWCPENYIEFVLRYAVLYYKINTQTQYYRNSEIQTNITFADNNFILDISIRAVANKNRLSSYSVLRSIPIIIGALFYIYCWPLQSR